MDIPIVSWVDSIIKDAFKSVFESINESTDDYVRSLDVFNKGRQKYFEFLRDRHGSIQILGMSQPIALDRIYVTVSVNTTIQAKQYLDTDTSAVRDQRSLRRRLKSIRAQTSVDPLTVLAHPRSKSIVLGKPGCGKSTLLKNIALIYSGNTESHHPNLSRETALFPILVQLRDFQHEMVALENNIVTTMERCGFPHADLFLRRMLQSGKALVLLDGLDEVEPKYERQLHRAIFDLVAKYPFSSYVLSSRTAAYKGNAPGFTEVEIEDFSRAQRIEFVNNWFLDTPDSVNDLLSTFKNYPQLEELAENPLLLSLMCILYERELSLPGNRVELYKKCVRTMLVEWDASRGFRRITKYEALSEQKKIRLLNFCAATLFEKREIIFSKRTLIGTVKTYLPKIGLDEDESLGVVNEIASHHGILIPVGATTWCFSHLTLHEYFTACYVVDTRGERRLLKFLEDAAWIEVFNTVANLLEDASDFVESILDSDTDDEFYRIALAAHCSAGDAVVSREVRQRMVDLLRDALIQHSDKIRRIYETRWDAGRRRVLFFEASNSKDIPEFLSALNCLVSIADIKTLSRLAMSVKGKGRKVEKIVASIAKAKKNGHAVHVVSNVLPKHGISLPMQMTNFRTRMTRLVSQADGGKPVC